MTHNFEQQFKPVIDRAVREARSLSSPVLTSEHLLLGSMRPREATMRRIFATLKLPVNEMITELENHIKEVNATFEADADMPQLGAEPIHPAAVRYLKLALAEARRMRSPGLFGAHLLLALIHDPRSLDNEFLREFKQKYLNFDISMSMNNPFSEENGGFPSAGFQAEDEDYDEENEQPRRRSGRKGDSDKPSSSTPALDKYGVDMTANAAAGKLDPVVGREREIERVVQILSRRTKNNPCLIGEPGVGKTAVAEGLALRIAAGEVPAKLRKKEVQLLDLTALVAGTQFRGQFESRIKGLVDEVKQDGNIILFIDEVHNLVGQAMQKAA